MGDSVFVTFSECQQLTKFDGIFLSDSPETVFHVLGETTLQ